MDVADDGQRVLDVEEVALVFWSGLLRMALDTLMILSRPDFSSTPSRFWWSRTARQFGTSADYILFIRCAQIS